MELMGWGELTLAGIMGLAGIGFMLLAEQTEGSAGVLRSAIGNIASAREQYDAEKGNRQFRLRIKGRDNRSHATIDGEYPVIGDWSEGGFLLQTIHGAKSLCKSDSCDWYASHAVLLRGEAVQTSSFSIERDRLPLASLQQLMAQWAPLGDLWLLGEAQARDIKPDPPGIEATGERARLHYAHPEQLQGWPLQLRALRLTLQLRHAPGLQPPALTLPEQAERPGLHRLLHRWSGR
jgi:inner membrane protein